MSNKQTEIYNEHQQEIKEELKEKLIKEIFDMVYQWGRVGLVVDETAPAYRSTVDKLINL